MKHYAYVLPEDDKTLADGLERMFGEDWLQKPEIHRRIRKWGAASCYSCGLSV
jgi:hypothetical protein